MNIQTAKIKDIDELKTLWKDIFSDTDDYINLFFKSKFKTENTFVLRDSNIVSMVYCVDQMIDNHKCSYICGVATKKDYRNKGHCKKLMEFALAELEKRNFEFVFLIPSTTELFDFYGNLGFNIFSYLDYYTHMKENEFTQEKYQTEFDYDKLNMFYNNIKATNKPFRELDDFYAIYKCYENLRIYDSGYLVYHIENDILNIIEHTFNLEEIKIFANTLLNEFNLQTSVITSKSTNLNNGFSMAKRLKGNFELSNFKENYVNLMLN